jgi:hypothetical protein
MIIRLQRQWAADDPAYLDPDDKDRCGVCGRTFEQTSIVAWATTDDQADMGMACPSCLEHLGRRNPEKFPTIEEYRALLEKYPEAMYESTEALEAAAQAAGYEDSSDLVHEPSWVWRPRENATT